MTCNSTITLKPIYVRCCRVLNSRPFKRREGAQVKSYEAECHKQSYYNENPPRIFRCYSRREVEGAVIVFLAVSVIAANVSCTATLLEVDWAIWIRRIRTLLSESLTGAQIFYECI